jgi:hypothetical protein
MTQLTTFLLLLLSLSVSACFHEDVGPTEATSGTGSTSTGTSTDGASDSTSGVAIEPAPARSCAAPEDVPPSLPGLEIEAELEPLASTTCPTSW